MLTVTINDQQVKQMLASLPTQANRSLEMALDQTATMVKDRIRNDMDIVFDNPTAWTKNSIYVKKTRGHNMTAVIGLKQPTRRSGTITEHYLQSEIFGGERRDKGLEKAMASKSGGMHFIPATGVGNRVNGNISGQTIQEVIAKLNKGAGKTSREYVFLPKGSGPRPPGIYQRIKDGKGYGSKRAKLLPFGAWQTGRKRGRFGTTATMTVADLRAVTGRGLKPIMVQGRDTDYRVRLPFFKIGNAVISKNFPLLFSRQLHRLMGGR